jgi:ferric-dicitrate binding protein FerR (iron transport regulator)
MNDLKNTLNNFFRNRYTRHEYFSVYRGFEKDNKDKPFLEELEKQWDGIDDTGNPENFKQKLIWNKIIRQIDQQSITSKSTVRVWHFIQKVAAILFLPLLIASLFYFYAVNQKSEQSEQIAWAEINCPAGVRTAFQLPDGSTGFLNSKSTLKYPVNFGTDREVYLTGEAFFDVVKSEKSRFRVITQKLETEVLGTSFNIAAYEDQPYEEITLKIGKLKVLDKNNKELSTLIPDQQFVFDTLQDQFTIKEVNAVNFTSWTEGKLIIQDERFEDVVKKLSRWYDVEMEIEHLKLKDFRYYAKFEDEPLTEVLRLIAITAPIQYQEEPRIKKKDGSFSKRKIKFRLNENRIENFN